jgi:thiol-disulfide isomerase/thioredoxin
VTSAKTTIADDVEVLHQGLAGQVPDAGLLDAHGQPVTLSAARGGRPAVVVFYRGEWCPYCNVTLRNYQANLVPVLAERGVGPTVALPDAGGVIRWIDVHPNYATRTEVADIAAALDAHFS